MAQAQEKLGQVAAALKSGRAPEKTTVRDLLRWFGAQRRGYWIVLSIRKTLRKHGLATKPDFEGAYIDQAILFELLPRKKKNRDLPVKTEEALPDPTYRIGKLASANTSPARVKPDETLEKATTVMLSHDFSQLPVMTNDRDVKGTISWYSIGSRLALGRKCKFVRDCMDSHKEISSDTSLFDAIDMIVANQYVLIRDSENVISGIVTTSDLSVQFKQLGEPFLLIGEIENYIRRVLQDKFTAEELAAAKDPEDQEREVRAVSDLTFGEYRRLLEKPERWKKLELAVDRVDFAQRLDEVRRIRNDVMHFDPDGIPDDDLKILRDFVKFLQNLANMKVI